MPNLLPRVYATALSSRSRSSRKRRNASSRSGVASTVSDFRLENSPPVPFDQDAQNLAHSPAWGTDHLQAGWRSPQQRDAAVAKNSYTIRVTLEGLQLKSFQIKALQLLCGVWHGYIL